MAKQILSTNSIGPNFLTTFTNQTVFSRVIEINTLGQFVGFPSANTISTTGVFILAGTPNQISVITTGTTATLSPISIISSGTYLLPAGMTFDNAGRISAISVNTTTNNQAPGITFTPYSITVNQFGFITTSVAGISSNFTSIVIPPSGKHVMGAMAELFVDLTGATGTVTHNFNTSHQWRHSSIASNFTANFTNIPVTQNISIGVSLILNQGATPYLPTAVQINGSATAIKWLGSNGIPIATANRIEFVSFTLININGTWLVLGSLSSYG